MKYKLIGIRPNHKQMKSMVGKSLIKITDGWLEKCYITDVKINDLNKWEFVLTNENTFVSNEPLFISVKSAKRYAKQNGIKLNAGY